MTSLKKITTAIVFASIVVVVSKKINSNSVTINHSIKKIETEQLPNNDREESSISNIKDVISNVVNLNNEKYKNEDYLNSENLKKEDEVLININSVEVDFSTSKDVDNKYNEAKEFKKIEKLFESSDGINLSTIWDMALTNKNPDFVSEYVDLYVLKCTNVEESLSLVRNILLRTDLTEPSLLIDFTQSLYNYTTLNEISDEKIISTIKDSVYFNNLNEIDKKYINKSISNIFSKENNFRKSFFEYPGNELKKTEWISLHLPDQY